MARRSKGWSTRRLLIGAFLTIVLVYTSMYPVIYVYKYLGKASPDSISYLARQQQQHTTKSSEAAVDPLALLDHEEENRKQHEEELIQQHLDESRRREAEIREKLEYEETEAKRKQQMEEKLREEQELEEKNRLEEIRKQTDILKQQEAERKMAEVEAEMERKKADVKAEMERKKKLEEARKPEHQTLKENSLEMTNPAIVLLAHNRPKDLRRTLLAFSKLVDMSKFTLYISCDYEPMIATFKGIASNPELGGIVKDVWLFTTPIHSESKFHRSALYKISEHYRFALTTGFDLRHSHIIMTEDDLVPSPDFLTFFRSTAYLLDKDPTLYCISAWNDNGFVKYASQEKELYRTDFFPGLGWMIKKEHFYKTLKDVWPQYASSGWDLWFRTFGGHDGLSCIIPEVNRVQHVSSKGSTVRNSKFYTRYAVSKMPGSFDISHKPYGDLSYLLKANFEKKIRGLVSAACRTTFSTYESSMLGEDDFSVCVVLYKKQEYKVLGKRLGLWPGEARGGYRGIIQLSLANSLGQNGENPVLLLAERRDAAEFIKPEEAIVKHPKLQAMPAPNGQACNFVCAQSPGMRCDADQLAFITNCKTMKEHYPCERGCGNQLGKEIPCYVTDESLVTYQQCLLDFSETLDCGAKHKSTRRLCACVPVADASI